MLTSLTVIEASLAHEPYARLAHAQQPLLFSCAAIPNLVISITPPSAHLCLSICLSLSLSLSLTHTHTPIHLCLVRGPATPLPGPVPASRARFPPPGPGAPPLVIGVRQSLGPASPSAARAGPGSGRPRPAAPTRRWPPRTPPRPHRPPRAQQRRRRSPAGASLAHARTGVSAGKAGRGAAKGRARVQHP